MTEKTIYLDLANEDRSISIKRAIAAAAVCTCKEHHYNYTLSAVRVSIEKDGRITVDATDTAIAFVAEFKAKVIDESPLPRAFLVPREIAAKIKPTQHVIFYGDEICLIEGASSVSSRYALGRFPDIAHAVKSSGGIEEIGTPADFKKAPAETERLTSGHGGILGDTLEKVAKIAKKACCRTFNPVPYGRAYSCILLCGNTPKKQTAVEGSKWVAHVVAMSYHK